MKLWRRQPEPEPVDRDEEWADLLHCFRTRSSVAMKRELYHREARQRQQVRAMVKGPTRGSLESRSIRAPVRGHDAPPPAPSGAVHSPSGEPQPAVRQLANEPRPLTYEEQVEAIWAEFDAGERAWPTWSWL
jgi:hypothetical protein